MNNYHLSLEVEHGNDEFWNDADKLPNKAKRAAKVIEEIEDQLAHRGFTVKVDLIKVED